MKTILFVAAGAATLIAAPVCAQERSPFAGPRIELKAGWDNDVGTVTYNDGTTNVSASSASSGVSYGGEAGFDFATGVATTLGFYAGIDGATTKDCVGVSGGERECLEADRNLYVGVRGGFRIGRGALGYIKGGYSNGRFSDRYTDPSDPSSNYTASDNLDGFHVGAGVEALIARRAYAKLEYTYTDYNGYEVDIDAARISADLSRHHVTAGVGVRF